VEELAEAARDAGALSLYREMKSDVGHDAFLADPGQVSDILGEFFDWIGFGR
jgi:homoserine acetyltransferase